MDVQDLEQIVAAPSPVSVARLGCVSATGIPVAASCDSTPNTVGPDLTPLTPWHRDDRKPVLSGPANAVIEKWTDPTRVPDTAQGDFAGAAGVCGV